MKWLFIAGVTLFEAGSALCGGAPNMNALICGRVLAGIGGTGLYLGCLNFISAMSTPQERGAYVTGIGFVWGLGAVLGPVIGGAFSQSSATWRWGFYINLVIGAITAPVFIFWLPQIRPVKDVSIINRLLAVDWVGSILSFAMWSVFAFVFISAGSLWAWSDGRTIAMIVVFGVLLTAYALQQYFTIFTTRERRSFPGHLIPNRTQTLLYVATASSVATTFVAAYYIPIYFQFVRNDGPIQAAVRLLPLLLFQVSANLGAGYLLGKVKYYMPFFFISGAFMLTGGVLFFVYLKPSTSPAVIYGISIITGFGSGLVFQLGFAVATLTVPPKDIIHAISYQYISQIGGIVISLVIAGQIFQSQATDKLLEVLSGLGFDKNEVASVAAGAQSVIYQKLSPDTKEQAILAITDAMCLSFTLIIISGGLMMIASAFMKREKLFGDIALA
ncbi:MFS drug efflux transporter [Xylogone sp. PMI_703]|nr:MFS drug efflux transporter [Xylogone sp. PMI_703]